MQVGTETYLLTVPIKSLFLKKEIMNRKQIPLNINITNRDPIHLPRNSLISQIAPNIKYIFASWYNF